MFCDLNLCRGLKKERRSDGGSVVAKKIVKKRVKKFIRAIEKYASR